jgi:hypothetical protein
VTAISRKLMATSPPSWFEKGTSSLFFHASQRRRYTICCTTSKRIGTYQRPRHLTICFSRLSHDAILLLRFETQNLLVTGENDLSVIGKAEGLKVLLIEWMTRHDSVHRYFSDPKYSYNRTRGDIQEVTQRRTWKEVPFWISDSSIQFFPPSYITPQDDYRRNEYIYIGRTLPGVLELQSITVRGPNAAYFSVLPTNGTIGQYHSLRIKVSYHSKDPRNVTQIQAFLDIRTTALDQTVPIHWST